MPLLTFMSTGRRGSFGCISILPNRWPAGSVHLLHYRTTAIEYVPLPNRLGEFYFRGFRFVDTWYALSKGGRLYRSPDGLYSFSRGPNLFPRVPGNTRRYNAPGSVRHVGVETGNGCFDVFYSRIGDAPERILKSRVDATKYWRRWRAGPPEEVLAPTETWEGATLPVEPSRLGAAENPVHQLRDQAPFLDDDGNRYLVYTAAGEHEIGLARLSPKFVDICG